MWSRHSFPRSECSGSVSALTLLQVVVFLPMIKHSPFIATVPPSSPRSPALRLSLFVSLFPPTFPLSHPPPSCVLLAATTLSLSLPAITVVLKRYYKSASVPLQSYDSITVCSLWHIHTITHTASDNTCFSLSLCVCVCACVCVCVLLSLCVYVCVSETRTLYDDVMRNSAEQSVESPTHTHTLVTLSHLLYLWVCFSTTL